MLRIVAAALVIVSHSFLLPSGGEPYPLSFGGYGYTMGRIGVIVFFVISGYLVCGSWLAEPRVRRYAGKRARRLYPALFVMVLLVTLVVGPIVTTSKAYFADPQTWFFLVRNLLIFPYDYHLPGVFTNNPNHDVNGVVWTLGVEVAGYILLALAGKLGMIKRPLWLVGAALAFSLAGWGFLTGPLLGDSFGGVNARAELLAYFFAAAAFRAFRFVPTWWHALIAAVVLVVVTLIAAPVSIVLVPAATVIVLYLGTRRWRPAGYVTRFGDPSYGTYIYGFLVQQLLIFYGLGSAPTLVFAIVSLVISLGLGYASWHLLEKRFVVRSPVIDRTPLELDEPPGGAIPLR